MGDERMDGIEGPFLDGPHIVLRMQPQRKVVDRDSALCVKRLLVCHSGSCLVHD